MRLILDTHTEHRRDFRGVCWINRASTVRHLHNNNLLCNYYTNLLSFRTFRGIR